VLNEPNAFARCAIGDGSYPLFHRCDRCGVIRQAVARDPFNRWIAADGQKRMAISVG
jgi:hypothetical protein